MDNYVLRSSHLSEDPKPLRRVFWTRFAAELDGKFSLKYHREASALMRQSYTQVGNFPHFYHINGGMCDTHCNRVANSFLEEVPFRREGISGIEFDSKGVYLASVTKSGCLVVQDFEALYCLSNGLSTCMQEDENKHLIHISTGQQLDVVRWNLANQDEVACTSTTSNEVRLFDIGYISCDPIEVLKKRPKVTVNGCGIPRGLGLSDIAFSSVDKSRLLASDMYGVISLWDRRSSNLPCVELTTDTHSPLNSIQLGTDNQIVYGAGRHGIIYTWDLRGGRTSAAFQSNKEVYRPPLLSLKLAPLLEKIKSLKQQAISVPRAIYSIDLDPCTPYQLAFHLENGWSGVVNTKTSQVTHIHCPPPAWLNDTNMSNNDEQMRKPTWLPSCSIYAVGCTYDSGIHLLDFHPSPVSACHVDFNEEMQQQQEKRPRELLSQNGYVPLSEYVTACAAHPLNGAIIAGTKQSSLLLISQKCVGIREEDNGSSNQLD